MDRTMAVSANVSVAALVAVEKSATDIAGRARRLASNLEDLVDRLLGSVPTQAESPDAKRDGCFVDRVGQDYDDTRRALSRIEDCAGRLAGALGEERSDAARLMNSAKVVG